MTSSTATLSSPTPGLWSTPYAAPSLGMLALISIWAFEQLAVATVMPVVAAALDGHALYAAAFGAAVAAGIVGLVWSGRWSDRAGPGAPMWTGALGFVAGLLIAGLAPDMATLVLGRVLQGAGGGLMSVALYVVVGQHYPPALHPRIFAAFAAAWVLPAIVGPALAGFIESQWGWRWVFLAAALLTVPAALLVQRGLATLGGESSPRPIAEPADAPATRRTPMVVAGGAALGAGLLYLARPGKASAWLWAGLGLAALALFAPRLLPAGSLRARPGLPAVVGLRGLAAAAFLTAEVFIPLVLTQQRGFSPVQAGLVLTLGALGWSLGSWWQGRLGHDGRQDGIEIRIRLLHTGMGLMALGTLALAGVLWPALPVAVAVAGWALTGLGIGMVYPTLSVLTLRFAPPAEQGQASSALQLSDSLVSAVALAGAGALLAGLQAGAPASGNVAGYLAGFGVALALAIAGLLLARRCRPA
jgi:MFS family permease